MTTAPGATTGTSSGAVLTDRARRRAVAYAAATLAVLVVFTGTVFVHAIPANVLAPNRTTASDVTRAISPQGWSFFTRDAREETYRAWVVGDDGAWDVVAPVAGAAPEHLLGLVRTGRMLDSDVSLVAEKAASEVAAATGVAEGSAPATAAEDEVPDATDRREPDPDDDVAALPASGREGGSDALGTAGWQDCGTRPATECFGEVAAVARVELRPVSDVLCGRVGIARTQPIPWAFGRLTTEQRKRVVVVDVECLS